ncbi:MAG: hypothetical protein JWO38_7641 [Gemmataceae bacterium]|nr:hypothetical protein [Gemmataceae bacterium]
MEVMHSPPEEDKHPEQHGFCCRATHNLWVLLEEEKWLAKHIEKGSYARNYSRRGDNSVYKPITDELLRKK